jgi:pSer/pThr/pTyr-binding forkhead associated (FHA) protein
MLPQRVEAYTASTEDQLSGDAAVCPVVRLKRNGITIQEVPLDAPRVVVGRTPDNDLSIPTRYVSRHHVLLVRDGRATVLVDLDSTNGTFVNAERADKRVLAHGDVIEVDRRSLFVSYAIEYCDPSAVAGAAADDALPTDPEIEKLVASLENGLVGDETDRLPALSVDAPTVVGTIDDR